MPNNSLQEKLARYEREEELLQFTHFSNDDALRLGLLIIDNAKKQQVQPAIEIIINGYTVFRYGFAGTNNHNTMWLKRKSNTVNTVHMSSLRAGTVLACAGEEMERDWLLPAQDYTGLGGGFPVRIQGSGVIGSICCSGLPHEIDHQMVVDSVAQWLGITL